LLTTKLTLGILLIVLAMSLIGLIDNFIKLIAAEAGLWEFHFIRSLVACAVVVILARVFGWRLTPKNWWAVGARSFFFSTAMVLYFGAAGIIPIAQAGAGLFTSPIFVLLISVLFLRTRIGFWRIAATGLGFVGVILILRPQQGGVSIVSLVPVAAGLLYALNGISTRRWCGGETTATLLMGLFVALGLWGAIGLAVFTAFPVSPDASGGLAFFTRGWVSPTVPFVLWTLVQAFGSLIAVALLTRGYQLVEVSFAAVAEYTFLISAAFWTWILWAQIPDARAFAGAGAITVSGIIIALRSR